MVLRFSPYRSLISVSIFCLVTMVKTHSDIRWNPELKEWYCADCGITSDHATKEDATQENGGL